MIDIKQIEKAQKQWSDYILKISSCFNNNHNNASNKETYTKIANELVDNLYGYNCLDKKVLFKPTKVMHKKFRTTKKGALSYFIGSDDEFPEDKGFALSPWVAIKFNNHDIYQLNDLTIVTGEYFFTDNKKTTTNVEYSIGYIATRSSEIKIILHHSSMPYNDNS